MPPPLLRLLEPLLVLSALVVFEASLGVIAKKCMGSAPAAGAEDSPLASTRYALPQVSLSGAARGTVLYHAGHE